MSWNQKSFATSGITRVWKRAKRTSHWEFHPNVRSGDERTIGEKAADAMRHGMGSWPFVFGFIGFMAVWMVYNAYTNKPFDPFPYILLNLRYLGVGAAPSQIIKDVPATAELVKLS